MVGEVRPDIAFLLMIALLIAVGVLATWLHDAGERLARAERRRREEIRFRRGWRR